MTDEPLRNPRHETFAQLLAKGMPASRAFVEAGYAPNDGNAIRLKGNEKVQARLAHLQAQTAASAKITIESICAELAEATAVAKSKGQAQAMVSASALRAKLAGLMVERVEVGEPGSFDGLESTKAIAAKVLEQLVERFCPVDQKDLDGLVEMYERHIAEAEEYIAAIRARPIAAERADIRSLKTPWQQLEHYSAQSQFKIARRLNGNKTPAPPIEREVRKIAAEE